MTPPSASFNSAQLQFSIAPLDESLRMALQQALDDKTKPLGSLGRLEALAVQIGLIQCTLRPVLSRPHCIIFAADHGIVAENVSAYPQEVTLQMVLNFLRGGAAMNVFSRHNGIELLVVDAGVQGTIHAPSELLDALMHAKVAHGTRNFATQAAMTNDECLKAIGTGATIVRSLHDDGVNVLGLGEMGIGNTSSAAALMSVLLSEPLERCVGRGTGIDDAQLAHKISVLKRALALHQPCIERTTQQPAHRAFEALCRMGGLEIAMMCGAALQAAELGMVILVDGFISTTAILVASQFAPEVLPYCVFSHCSDENGHALLLERLHANPLLQLGLRLGEGTGVALAYPLVRSAVAMLNEMATFASASVSTRTSS
jgi:nicotinate-nucleotide--dimethylbenzimidazole phosphoribosyltransferase